MACAQPLPMGAGEHDVPSGAHLPPVVHDADDPDEVPPLVPSGALGCVQAAVTSAASRARRDARGMGGSSVSDGVSMVRLGGTRVVTVALSKRAGEGPAWRCPMSGDERGIDVARRENLGALLGVIGGTLGLAALTGCEAQASGAPEEATGLAVSALSGTDIVWVDTVLGAAPPNARTGDLATKAGGSGTGTLNATVAIARGCVTVGDGGGGAFFWDSSSTTGDDGGTIIVPPAKTGRWVRVHDHTAMNVLWFGATGGGVTADDPAIQKAINAAALENTAAYASGGAGVVLFPPGGYLLNNSLTIWATNVSGTNQSNVVLRGVNGGGSGEYRRSTLLWNGNATSPMLAMYSRDNIVEHLQFYVMPGKTCVCAIDDTQYFGSPNPAANTNNTYRHLRISSDSTGGLFTYGIKLGDVGYGKTYPDNVDYHRFEAVYISLAAAGGVIGVACVYCPSTTGQSKHHYFEHCAFVSAEYALQFQSGSFHTVACGFSHITKTCIYVGQTTDALLIESCDVEHCPQMFWGGGQSGLWPVVFQGGRFDVSSGDGAYNPYIESFSGGPLVLMGVLFGPPAAGVDTFSVACYVPNPGSGAGGTLVAIGCAFPNTVKSSPFVNGTIDAYATRIIALGNHRFNPTAGTFIAPLDDQIFSINGAPAQGAMRERLRIGSAYLPNNTFGTQTISGSNLYNTVTFATAEPDASYNVVCTIDSVSGTSPVVSTPYASLKTTTGFRINVPQAPGGTLDVNWMLVRTS